MTRAIWENASVFCDLQAKLMEEGLFVNIFKKQKMDLKLRKLLFKLQNLSSPNARKRAM